MNNALATISALASLIASGTAAHASFDFNPSSDHAGNTEVVMDDNCCDRMITEAVCHDTHGNRDTGLIINVYSGGFAGITTAILSEQTIAGPQPLGTVVVTRDEDSQGHPGLIAYRGSKFTLIINTAESRDGFSPAKVKTKIKGQFFAEDLICRVQ